MTKENADCSDVVSGFGSPLKIMKSKKISSSAKVLYSIFLFGGFEGRIKIDDINDCGLGRDARRNALRELEKIGVCELVKIRNKDGQVTGSFWRVLGIIPQKETRNNNEMQEIEPTESTESLRVSSLVPVLSYNTNTNTAIVDTGAENQALGGFEKQNFISPVIETIPEEMKDLDQWVFWRGEYLHDKNKPTKIPYQNKKIKAKSNDSKTWQGFKNMEKWHEFGMSGIGFVLSEKDQFTIIDLDNCIKDGQWNDFAKQTVKAFDSYTELSPSGTGLHIIVTGKINKAVKTDKIEIYYTSRYMAMTGCILLDVPIMNRQKLLDKALLRLCKPKKTANTHHPPPTNGNGKFTMPDEMFPEGNRNNELARWAGILNTKNISENDYYGYLNQINIKCCQPPLNDSEVEAIGKSISRYA